MEEYGSIQQLKKKEPGAVGELPIYPTTMAQAVYDAKTGASLEAILAQYNNIYVQYQGSAKDTRNIIPVAMRRAGMMITYMTMDGETITERAASAVQKDNDHWGLDVNWTRIDELSLAGDISVTAQGTWVINGEDTKVAARGPKGDNGLTPWLKTINNKLHYSYDNVTWEVCSEPIAAYFRWSGNKIQISRDNKTWSDLSGEFADNLRIKGYVATKSALPSSASQGDIYGVGPTYAEEDTARTNPIYRFYVRNANAWVDNGSFTSIAAGIVQETGEGENVVMSQKAVSAKLTELGSKSNVVTLIGKGSDGVFQKIYSVVPGGIYRIYNLNGDWEAPIQSSDTSAKFEIYYQDKDGKLIVPIKVLKENEVYNWYDITIPEDYTNRGLYIYARAEIGTTLSFVVEKRDNLDKKTLTYNDNECLFGISYDINGNGYIQVKEKMELNNPIYSRSFRHTVIQCKKGDVFLIKGKGGTGSGLLFALTDENGKRITYSEEDADYSDKPFVFYCYADGYLVVNVNITYPFSVIRVDKRVNQLNDETDLLPYVRLTEGYIRHYNGGRAGSSELNYKTNYLPVFGYQKIRITVNNVTGENVSTGIAFYDIDRNFISGISSVTGKADLGVSIEEYNIPNGTYTFASTIFKEFESELRINLLKDSEDKVQEVELEHNGFFNGYINSKGHNFGIIGSSDRNLVSGKIDVRGVIQLRLLMNFGINPDNTTGLVFFDSSNNPILGYTSNYNKEGTEVTSIEEIISVPSNADYAITTILNQFKDDFYVYGVRSVDAYNNLMMKKVESYREDMLFHKRYSNCLDFGIQPAADGSHGSFCNVKSGTYMDLINEVYEPLRLSHPNYIKRTSIGFDSSGTIEMFVYEFEPRYYQQHVYLQAGIHGDEPDAVACLARIMQMIVNASHDQNDLMFLRQNIKFTIVPCVNVWGFSQNPKKRQTYNDVNMQQWNLSNDESPNEIANIKNFVSNIISEVSFMADMHTTTNDTYRDFYANLQPNAKNVRTLYRTNAWLCENYALDGRTVDDQFIGYYMGDDNVFRRYYYNKGVETATIELSDYHWDNTRSTSKVITIGITMFLNYIIQMVNDFYKSMYNIPQEDYRQSKG